MVGQIPGKYAYTKQFKGYRLLLTQISGLQSFNMGPVLGSTAHRAQGYDYGIMTVMDTEADVLAYAPHPAHQKVHKIREALCTETIVFDMVL